MPRRLVVSHVRRPGDPAPVDLHLAGTRVEAVRPAGSPLPEGARRLDGAGLVACPGFIDLHVHGGGGADFMDASEEAFRAVGEYHAAGGTTSYLPTTATETREAILACVDTAARCREQRIGGVQILGVHVEGPYLAPTKHGCHHRQFVRPPSREENRGLLERAHIVKRVTCAPELPGAAEFIEEASRLGIVVSGGHSEATLDETRRAADLGMGMITHLYSVMSTIRKDGPRRVPGMLEAALLDDRLSTELIVDLRHVCPELVHLALKAKARDTICFVTDAMRGAGMPDGRYTFGSKGGTPVVVEDGIARNEANTGFASSTVRMVDLVRNAVEVLGLDLETAVRHASAIPAKILGLADRKGALEPGMDADLVLLRTAPRLDVYATIAQGEVLFQAGG